jgi:chemotaxis-related protein WspB
MLFVVFKAGEASYALEACQVVEVIPLVTLRKCPGAPGAIAGLMNYGGAGVPVVDLGSLTGGAPSIPYLSTRIIVTHYAGGEGRQRVLGLLAESVTNTVERKEDDFCQGRVGGAGSLCLGKLAVDGAGFIQRIVAANLVMKELEAMLFAEPEGMAS